MADKQTGFITIGPKSASAACIAIYYTPTADQIRNLQELFGWDYVSCEGMEMMQKELYGRQE